jgi:hypothetical protein
MRPIAHSGYKTMFHGVEVNVIDVPLEISIIADCVFPEATLPKRVFPISVARDRSARLYDGGRESAFDQRPAIGEIGVSVGQRHDDVDMIGQHDDRIGREWVLPPRLHYRRAQSRDVIS